MKKTSRSENEIFSDLKRLCAEDGYANAIAYFCFRDATYKFKDILTFNDIQDMYNKKGLIRTEISCLVGLMVQGKMILDMPSIEIHHRHITETETLLEELHISIASIMFLKDTDKAGDAVFNSNIDIHSSGEFIRESILYGSESAYAFQYQDLFLKKYQKDNQWFLDNKGYDISSAVSVFQALMEIRQDKANQFAKNLPPQKNELISYLPELVFNIDEVVERSAIDRDIVKNVIHSFEFSFKGVGHAYSRIDDFNATNAFPFIKIREEEYLLYLNHSLFEATYETPFFWLNADKLYCDVAKENRGSFTEDFTTERLINVFGKSNVYQNINIYIGKKLIGEIDTLVMYAGKAIIVQAKSKKLTINARRGEDEALKNDFNKAIQNAYDQGFLCASHLNDPKAKFLDEGGKEILFKNEIGEAFIMCVLSEHYPALNFQSRQFLKIKESEIIRPPFVTDVFFIDILCELLKNPLYALAYISQRTKYNVRLMSSNEIVNLGYHLQANLWLEEGNTLYMLDDDLSAGIDIAMIAIRRGVPGKKVPEGILTRFNNTFFDFLINELRFIDDPHAFELGKLLLSMSEETINNFNDKAKISILKAREDKKHHDLTIFIGGAGLIIHSNEKPFNEAVEYLKAHCLARKYKMRSDLCYGVLLPVNKKNPSVLIAQDHPWEYSSKDEFATDLFFSAKDKVSIKKPSKVGRNAPCPCGSAKKYKNCCINK